MSGEEGLVGGGRAPSREAGAVRGALGSRGSGRAQGQALEELALGRDVVEGLVGALGAAEAAGAHEALYLHGAGVHEQKRLHPVGLGGPHALVGRAGGLGRPDEQARGLRAQGAQERVGARGGLGAGRAGGGRACGIARRRGDLRGQAQRGQDLPRRLVPLAARRGFGQLRVRVAQAQRRELPGGGAGLPDARVRNFISHDVPLSRS